MTKNGTTRLGAIAGWIAAGIAAACAGPVEGAGVLAKDSSAPVFGYLVRNDSEKVILREVLPGGATREREFARSEIDELLLTVDVERLVRLDPDSPRDYLEYAEDLSEKRRDPEARDMALRLYVIAAYLAPDELGRGALLGMTALARSSEERRAFRALAYALDGGRDESLLRDDEEAGSRARPAVKNSSAADGLLDAVRQLRRGHRAMARRLGERKEVRGEFGRLQGILTYEEFQAACLDASPPTETLRTLLRAELALSGASEASTSEAKGTTWTPRLLASAPALPTPALERITEFDPRACLFRAGKWVERPKGDGTKVDPRAAGSGAGM